MWSFFLNMVAIRFFFSPSCDYVSNYRPISDKHAHTYREENTYKLTRKHTRPISYDFGLNWLGKWHADCFCLLFNWKKFTMFLLKHIWTFIEKHLFKKKRKIRITKSKNQSLLHFLRIFFMFNKNSSNKKRFTQNTTQKEILFQEQRNKAKKIYISHKHELILNIFMRAFV